MLRCSLVCVMLFAGPLAAFTQEAAAGPVRFHVTQPYPGSSPLFGCTASADGGRAMVGWVDNPFPIWDHAWLWTPCTTIRLTGFGFGEYASGVSNNGKVVIGEIINPSGYGVGVRWDAPAYVFSRLPLLGTSFVSPRAITPDGRTIVGDSITPGGQTQGYFLVNGSPPIGIGLIPGFTQSHLEAISPDVKVAVGHVNTNFVWRAAWYRPGVGLSVLPNPPGGTFQYARGVCEAGRYVVGYGTIGNTQFAMLSDGVSTVSLGTLPGDTSSIARGISSDGLVVIGTSYGTSSSLPLTSRTFVHIAGVGMLDLENIISGALGYTGLGSFHLGMGVAAGSDLRTFSGTAENLITGEFIGFQVNLCPADLNHDGRTDVEDFLLFVQTYNAGQCEADLNEDGLLTPADYTEFLNSLASGC